MADGETQGKADEPKREPWGPGPMILFGLGFFVVAGWCANDLFLGTAEERQWEPGTIMVNYVGLVYCFVAAARRSKAALPPAPDEKPSGQGGDETA